MERNLDSGRAHSVLITDRHSCISRQCFPQLLVFHSEVYGKLSSRLPFYLPSPGQLC